MGAAGLEIRLILFAMTAENFPFLALWVVQLETVRQHSWRPRPVAFICVNKLNVSLATMGRDVEFTDGAFGSPFCSTQNALVRANFSQSINAKQFLALPPHTM
jgi:hypothetical protein